MDRLFDEIVEFRKKYSCRYINEEYLSKLEYRMKKQEPDLLRSEFQRDRDRIIHSRAFRRLSRKTQVFSPNKGDHYRTRLTHSLEVSQIGRTIGGLFGLDENLIEAIALGHDLGHTPFGHVIERTLHDILKNNEIEDLEISFTGGFKHNFQSLHLVDNIEMGHREERGLNLTLAVRDGIIKHTDNKIRSSKTGKKEEVIYDSINMGLNNMNIMDYEHSITLEGQVVALSDEIAQSTHDLEDGVRSGIINIINLRKSFSEKIRDIKKDMDKKQYTCKQFAILYEKLKEWFKFVDNNKHIKSSESSLIINKLINILIDIFIKDALINSKQNILKIIKSERNIFDSQGLVKKVFIDNSKYIKKFREYISNYIYKNVVSSQEVSKSDSKAKYLIKQIFKAYYEDPRQLPDYALKRYFSTRGKSLDRTFILREKSSLQKDPRFLRMICDHIAGMTDSFAMEEYNNLYGVNYSF